LALAFGLALGASMVWVVPVQAAGAADSQATEMVRLMNGLRAANGKASLNMDPYLASLARNAQHPVSRRCRQGHSGPRKGFRHEWSV
jgi:uncharacterized protein YkwD